MERQLETTRTVSVIIALLVCQVLGLACVNARGAEYSAVKLQLPPTFFAYDAPYLSEYGRAGGYIRISNDVEPIDVAVVWDQAGSPGILPVAQTYRKAYVMGFSPDGRAVGNFVLGVNDSGSPGHWSSTGLTPLPHFGRGGAAFAASDSIVAGATGDPNLASYTSRATLWDFATGTARIVTGLPNVQSRVRGINSTGSYVGDLFAAGYRAAFYGRDGSGDVMSFPNADVLESLDVNDSDWAVGGYLRPGTSILRAFTANPFSGEFRDLGQFSGDLGAYAGAINDEGMIAGWARSSTGMQVAAVWPAGATEPMDLNALVDLPGVTLAAAEDINNAGQVLARGSDGFYILTPVPEPAMLAFIAFAGIAMQRRRGR